MGSDGEMAADVLIEDDDNYYYVDENGAMVRNQWVAVENEDAGEEDEPDHYWYYFQSNGKAYKRSDDSNSLSPKTINGKKYAFDTDGKMLYGWVNDSFERDDDEAWKNCQYYLGGEDDGAVRTNEWALIAITDDDDAKDQPGDDFWDEDQERWFYFKASGKKQGESTNKKINGKKYGFDEYGRMVASWNTTLTPVDKDATASNMATVNNAYVNIATSAQGTETYTESFMYFSNPEDGARYTKGWFKVVPGYYLHQGKYEDDSEYWYYADGDGNLVANEIKRIKGKKYGFDEYGRMISGLALLHMNNDTDIDFKIADDDDTDPYDTESKFNETAAKYAGQNDYRFYYFGGSYDGSMKTGKQTIDLDSDKFTFKFQTKSELKGAGINGEDDDKYYLGGKLVKADKEDKFMIVSIDSIGNVEAGYGSSASDSLQVKVKDLINNNNLFTKVTSTTDPDYKKEAQVWVAAKDTNGDYVTSDFRVVNTSGTVSKSKSVKDGDDYKITVDKNKVITKIVLED